MFECKVTNSIPSVVVHMDEMKPLQIGKIVTEDTPYTGWIVMRTASIHQFEVMVLAPDPSWDRCWSNHGSGHKVQLLPRGTELTITIV